MRAEFAHEGVEEIAVVDARAFALLHRVTKMREHVSLGGDNAGVDVVPVERDDSFHFICCVRRAASQTILRQRGADTPS